MAWNGSPASGTRRASTPLRLPIQWMSAPRFSSSAATASPALVCPPVPPPPLPTRMDSAGGSAPPPEPAPWGGRTATRHEVAEVLAGGEVDGRRKILGCLDLADPDARAQIGRLDEAREADLLGDRPLDRAPIARPVMAANDGVVHDGQPVGPEHVL